MKDARVPLTVWGEVVCPEHFQAFVQPDAAEVRAPGEGLRADALRAGGQVHVLDAAAEERAEAYLIESFWKNNVSQILALVEGLRFDGL